MITASQAQAQAQSSGCTMSQVVVNGITYATCGSTWYQPIYQGGQVSYEIVSPPH